MIKTPGSYCGTVHWLTIHFFLLSMYFIFNIWQWVKYKPGLSDTEANLMASAYLWQSILLTDSRYLSFRDRLLCVLDQHHFLCMQGTVECHIAILGISCLLHAVSSLQVSHVSLNEAYAHISKQISCVIKNILNMRYKRLQCC